MFPCKTALLATALFATLPMPGNAQPHALFEPPPGKRLLIVGQDLGAIGGFKPPNNQGYVDCMGTVPSGVTTYLSLPALRGMETQINTGTGDVCAQSIVENPRYAHSVLAIGLYFVDQEKQVAEGALDAPLQRLARWIKRSNRPIFLRIGYEFDGSWNHYDPVHYKEAFRHIVTLLRQEQVTNCATVWQGAASPVNGQHGDIALWYPGDDCVDWVGYSWFLSSPRQIELTDKLVQFAREHQKPVMVCESAPQGYDLARLTQRKITVPLPDALTGRDKKPKTPEQIWSEWYVPFFDYLEKNRDVIKVVAYINVNWDAQLMWGFPYRQGYWGDSRVQANPVIRQKWLETVSGDSWLQSSPTIFKALGFPAE